MKRPLKRHLGPLPVRSLAPNILTVLALCAGLTSIRFVLQERWELAVIAIVAAAILDAFDGRVARLLKGATKFGAELDSLSDFLCFGVAPALLLYQWTLHELEGLGWTIVLAYSVCCALRLARFNTTSEQLADDDSGEQSKFFIGVPAPGAAYMALIPVSISFIGGEVVFRNPVLVGFIMVGLAFLMVSRVPTYSFKTIKVKREYVLPTLIFVGVGAAILASYPWATLAGTAFIYMLTIPFSIRAHARLGKPAGEGGGGGAAGAEPESGES